MGAISDLLAAPKAIVAQGPTYQWLDRRIQAYVDAAAPSAAAAVDAVHTLATSTQTSGTFTITVTLRNGETFTTGALTFDDVFGDVETAIDSAATTASITGWTNGDISVAGGPVNVGPITLTFDGASVAGIAHPVSVLNDVDGAGGAWGAIALTTLGQSSRPALAVLINLAVVSSSTLPDQDLAVPDPTAVTEGDNYHKIPTQVVRDLAREMVEEDQNWTSYWTIMQGLGMLDDRAPAQAPVKSFTRN